MDVLVVNCGSSSLKASVIDADSGRRRAEHRVERIGEAGGPDHAGAVDEALDVLLGDGRTVGAVGHRVVHGGEAFTRPTVVDDAVLDTLAGLVDLAPLHLPANVAALRAARRHLPDVPHVAVFDTAFHHTLPRRAWRYALPLELSEEHGIRRYGFHGTSHGYVAQVAADHLKASLRSLRVITCHLGNGCSMAAVELGRSVETSMGMTPLEGLVMGTRSGDVDVGAVLQLARAEGLDLDDIDDLLNRRSGLAGLSGVGNDLRDIEARAADGDDRCREAIQVFSHRVRKYIGAYAAVMGGVDAVVFTGGIGENSAEVRHRAAQRLDFLGAVLDEDRNRDAEVDDDAPVADIGADHSRVHLLVVRTDEARAIAEQVAREVDETDIVDEAMTIPVAISARHAHLTDAHVEVLFGEGYELTPEVELSQPGQFAAEERITLVGPRGRLERVRVVGPTRDHTQVEISRTDEFALGIDAPIRRSGDIDNTPGLTIEGPEGSVSLAEGVIQSQRHIHMTPDDAERFGVEHKDIVAVAIDSDGRDLVFGDVVVRVKDSYALELHVDTDEGNAAQITGESEAVLQRTNASVRILRRTP